jgi:dTDP-4-amino-4,6-dideoxygalactose transaminase
VRALGLSGTEVVVPTNTFFATAAAAMHGGARVRLADVDAATLALSASTVEAAISDATSAVILVHVGGTVSPDTEAIRALCDRRGLMLIEDAAHAHGASWQGRAAGTFGVAAGFSFYPTKVVTSGEGGMIVTADEAVRDEAILYRDQGKAGFLGGEHVRLGYAWRMSELHAAVGVVHLEQLDDAIATRSRAAALYDHAMAEAPGITPLGVPDGCVSNYYKYIALLHPSVDRQRVKDRLREKHEVWMSGEVYARPLHIEPVFAELGDGAYPVADDVCRRHVCLPIHSNMTEAEAQYVADAVLAVVHNELGRGPAA